jgi:hypothetical protein
MSDNKTTWLTAPMRVWEAKCGKGSFPFGAAGRAFKNLAKAGHSPDTIADHLAVYLAQTPAQYRSIWKFAQNFAEFAPKPVTPLVDEFGVVRE